MLLKMRNLLSLLRFSEMPSELITFNHLRCHYSSTALGTRTGYWKPTRRGTDETSYGCFHTTGFVLHPLTLYVSSDTRCGGFQSSFKTNLFAELQGYINRAQGWPLQPSVASKFLDTLTLYPPGGTDSVHYCRGHNIRKSSFRKYFNPLWFTTL